METFWLNFVKNFKMEDSTVKRLGLILAVQAEIEEMKAMNASALSYGDARPRFVTQFGKKALELQAIVHKHPDKL
jgi:hypothetical protein